MLRRNKPEDRKDYLMTELAKPKHLYENIKKILNNARNQAYRAVNFAMVEAYWNIGRLIVEDEQKGKERADYGKYLLKVLSERLTDDFGKGFSQQSLWNIRQFYQTFPILSTLWRELTWSHYKLLIRIKDEKARQWYGEEAVSQNWSVRALDRQINSKYYQRLLATQYPDEVRQEAEEKTRPLHVSPLEFIKDPYVLEFLNMKPDMKFIEKELEQGLIDQLQKFLLELGKGFAFVARQQRIKTEYHDFFIDLVFYNYILKCFILIDLKTGELTHQDVGQGNLY